MKILIIGSSGFLGQELVKFFKNQKNIKLLHNGVKSKIFDLTNINNLEKIITKSNPQIIINCIGLTDLNICEKNKKLSNNLNYEIVKNIFIIKKKKKSDFKLIHISTDQLYDNIKNVKNTEKTKVSINNQYSKDKYKAEKIALKNKSLVLRVNFIGYSKKKSGFLHWIYKSFNKKKQFYLYDDVFFNPISISSLKKIMKKIVYALKNNKKIYGLYNLGSINGIYKNELAINFAKKVKIFNNKFINVGVNHLDNKVKKSKQMFMDVSKFEKKFQIILPYIQSEILKESKKFLNYDYKNRKK
tara:strand:- start:2696 stop:3595 length:900 start_codon:yes stop_codon:yes gene_type:complete